MRFVLEEQLEVRKDANVRVLRSARGFFHQALALPQSQAHLFQRCDSLHGLAGLDLVSGSIRIEGFDDATNMGQQFCVEAIMEVLLFCFVASNALFG